MSSTSRQELAQGSTILSGWTPRPAPRASKQFITEEELAGLIAVPAHTIAGWRRRGGGPTATRVGKRQIRYDLRDVAEWLRRNRLPERST